MASSPRTCGTNCPCCAPPAAAHPPVRLVSVASLLPADLRSSGERLALTLMPRTTSQNRVADQHSQTWVTAGPKCWPVQTGLPQFATETGRVAGSATSVGSHLRRFRRPCGQQRPTQVRVTTAELLHKPPKHTRRRSIARRVVPDPRPPHGRKRWLLRRLPDES